MDLEDKEHDPLEGFDEAFEGFGEPETVEQADLDAQIEEQLDYAIEQQGGGQEIDLSFADTRSVEQRPIETHAIDTAAVSAEASREIKAGFSWAAFAGGLASLVWIGGAIGGPLSYYGIDALMALDPALQAGLIALAFGPAVLFWLAAVAAGEAVKARRLAAGLARFAYEPGLPMTVGLQATVNPAVKNEIASLNDAVSTALARLNDLEAHARRNAALFDSAIAATRENAEYMANRLANERNALVELNGELRGQTDTMASSISRQVRLMREASKLVKTEITAAEDALESHLSSFNASASVMAERTASFHDVADSAASATASLNNTMSGMLDGLGEATRLTDAARQSAEQAVLAANETATAVRDTTRSAVFEAKKAAQAIRAETQALQDAAASTLENLRLAAEAARSASEESQAAADRHAASIEKRLSALAQTAGAARKPAPQAAPVQAQAPAPRVEQRPAVAERKLVVQPAAKPVVQEESLYAAASAAVARGGARPQRAQVETVSASSEARNTRGLGGLKGFGNWGNLFPQRDESFQLDAANAPEEADAFDLVDFEPSVRDPDIELKAEAIALAVSAGIDLDSALSAGDLETVAQRSRLGAVARRRAVADAAPVQVGRLQRHIKRNADARLIATQFRARPDLAKSERKGEASDLVRAYLLIDAALD